MKLVLFRKEKLVSYKKTIDVINFINKLREEKYYMILIDTENNLNVTSTHDFKK